MEKLIEYAPTNTIGSKCDLSFVGIEKFNGRLLCSLKNMQK